MGPILNFILVRDLFQAVVGQSVAELVAKLGAAVQPRRLLHRGPGGGYEGEVTESGFAIRRIATHAKDSKAAVVVRAWFRPEGERTAVRVVVRHGRHMVAFSWLLLLLFFAGVAGMAASAADRTESIT